MNTVDTHLPSKLYHKPHAILCYDDDGSGILSHYGKIQILVQNSILNEFHIIEFDFFLLNMN